MRAIILAAGRGGRLRGVTGDRPKCLARDRRLHAARASDPGAARLRRRRDHRRRRLSAPTMSGGCAVRRSTSSHNARLRRRPTACTRCGWRATCWPTGSSSSTATCSSTRSCCVDLLTARYEDALLMARRGDGDALLGRGDEGPRPRRPRRRRSRRRSTPADADGENIGIAKFGAAGARAARRGDERLIVGGGAQRLAAARVRRLLPPRARCTSSRRRGFPWIEIDFPEDYWRACTRRAAGDRALGRRGVRATARAHAAERAGRLSIMYERFYNLRERPFSLSPDPDYLYPSRVHKEALSYLRYGIEGHAGLHRHHRRDRLRQDDAAADGAARPRSPDVGLAAREHDARRARAARGGDARLRPRSAARAAASRTCCATSRAFSSISGRPGRLALLVIDEAQNLSVAALEEVRMLSNLETEKSKLIQIVLVGQPNLRDLLARPELEQLRQRVTVSYHLRAARRRTRRHAYINHRLRRAAIGAPLEFPRDVTDLIHRAQPGRAAEDQRHRRRGPAVRLRRGQARRSTSS